MSTPRDHIIANLLTNIPSHLPTELIQVLHQSPNIRIERIVSQGHTSLEGFWFDQETDEWVLLCRERRGYSLRMES